MSSKSFRLTIAALAAVGLIGVEPGPSAAVPDHGSFPAVQGTTRAAGQPDPAKRVFAQMSLAQRIGQLFMVGTPATSVNAATRAQIGRFHVGNVMLTGRSYTGTATPARVARMMQARTTQAATRGVRLLVSTDQEGGDVQVLHGQGISEIPSGLEQGGFAVDRLRMAAGRWASQLRAAGVNMNLAPVLDTVPSPAAAGSNPPIGVYDREYGFDLTRVGRHGTAFARGMAAHGVAPTIKHFPGLGRVHANPDTSAGVTDRVTRRHDPYLAPFRTAIEAGVPFVMLSTAYYSRMDRANPAAFSRFIVHTVLRGDLGFRRVVISDDLGNARQVSRWSYGARAVKFIRAGGDVVLTVNPDALPAMYRAVLSRARNNPDFRAKVNHAALRVLKVKQSRHLLGR